VKALPPPAWRGSLARVSSAPSSEHAAESERVTRARMSAANFAISSTLSREITTSPSGALAPSASGGGGGGSGMEYFPRGMLISFAICLF
jgi:hypothetical protein